MSWNSYQHIFGFLDSSLICLVLRVGLYVWREDLSAFLTMALRRKRIGAKSI